MQEEINDQSRAVNQWDKRKNVGIRTDNHTRVLDRVLSCVLDRVPHPQDSGGPSGNGCVALSSLVLLFDLTSKFGFPGCQQLLATVATSCLRKLPLSFL